MRRFFASLLAFVASLAAGEVVAQIFAVATGATEEYILVLMLTVLVAIVVTVPFFVAQFLAESRRAVNRVAVAFLVILVIACLGIVAWEFVEGGQALLPRDAGLVAGLTAPGLAIVLVQWLIVRGMLPSAYAVRFGRGPVSGA
ncbi:MAG: hypothetical protein AB7I79_11380 [Rhizobiaceae bacterium]